MPMEMNANLIRGYFGDKNRGVKEALIEYKIKRRSFVVS